MPNPTNQRIQMPWSLKAARRFETDPRKLAFYSELMFRDYGGHKDDFDGTLDGNYWTATNTGASSAAPVFNAQAGGALRFVTGGGNPGVSTLYGTNAIYNSDDNPILHVRFKYPAAVSNYVMEFGFVNVYSTKTTPSVTALGAQAAGATAPTISNGVTNGVLFVMNTGLTLATPALVGVGTSIAVAGTPINTAPNVPTAYSPTVAKWTDIYIGAGVGVGYCEIYENDAFIGQFAVASGPDTATLMFPVFLVKDLGTTKTLDMDAYKLSHERNTR